MQMKPLGTSGIKVSSVGLGCMNLGMMCDQATTDSIVSAAIEAGVNFFDTADIYGGQHGKAETLLGKALGDRRHGRRHQRSTTSPHPRAADQPDQGSDHPEGTGAPCSV